MAMIQVHLIESVTDQSQIQTNNEKLLATPTHDANHLHYNHSNEN
jgi:hypothetical protein